MPRNLPKCNPYLVHIRTMAPKYFLNITIAMQSGWWLLLTLYTLSGENYLILGKLSMFQFIYKIQFYNATLYSKVSFSGVYVCACVCVPIYTTSSKTSGRLLSRCLHFWLIVIYEIR